MAKFTNVGFVGVPKKDPDKRYLKIDLPPGMESITLKNGQFLAMQKPYKSPKMTEEAYEELTAWKRFTIVLVDQDEAK